MEVDQFSGQEHEECLYSARGDDVISAASGNDIVCGGKGEDWINDNVFNDSNL